MDIMYGTFQSQLLALTAITDNYDVHAHVPIANFEPSSFCIDMAVLDFDGNILKEKWSNMNRTTDYPD